MDVFLDNNALVLTNRIVLEGDKVVKDRGKSDSVIELPWEPLPTQVLQALSLDVEERDKPDFIVVKWTRHDKWITEPIIIIPIYGLFNHNGGKPILSGAASRVLRCEKIDSFFDLVKNNFGFGYNGPISIGFTKDLHITHLAKGLPEWLYFNVLNGHRSAVGDFFSDPTEGYFFSGCWTIGILLSCYPYPFTEEVEEFPIEIKRDLMRRVWDFGWIRHKGWFLFDKTKVGIITTYSTDSLKKANDLALITCGNIDMKFKQYRTDLDQEAGRRWAVIHESLGL